MTICIVGLGPGRYTLLTLEAASVLESAPWVHLRPPAVPLQDFPPSIHWESLEPVCQGCERPEQADQAIAEHLLQHARTRQQVVYVVLGGPSLHDSSVGRVLAAAHQEGIPTQVMPGVSGVEAALAEAGHTPAGQLQLLDAAGLHELEPTLPALVLGIGSREVASAARRALRRFYPPDHRLEVLGSDRWREVPLARLDQARTFDPLAAVYVPPLPIEAAPPSLRGVRQLVARLRAPDGCPWDREQTPASLAAYVIEEAYEVVEAIAEGSASARREELGDLLLQVLMQAQVAAEAGEFDLAGVARELGAKLVRRHPHVFGEGHAETAAEVLKSWERLKAEEKGERESILSGVPRRVPALASAQEIQKRVSRAGFDWPTRAGAEAKLREELHELLAARSREEVQAELGDALFILAKLGLSWEIDAELALRAANERFAARFAHLERTLRRRGQEMQATPLAELLELWQEAKRNEQKPRRSRRPK
ncbi:MAG: nucleoside triphosphate pyrophosphohydrolase [Chloroflexi bacterium]|nr:nucleoside triphosphate pyrophosphohydrolase [Chloroflexota bacterium]